MRSHVLDRTGYGTDDWSAARTATLGLQGYLDEQLDPDSIDESGNTELQSRLGAVGDPPIDINELIALQVIRASYSYKQLSSSTRRSGRITSTPTGRRSCSSILAPSPTA